MVEIKNLNFGYIKQPLCIKDFNLYIEEGDKVVFLGGEGMGKTSLLKLICGLEKQYFGDIVIDGENIKGLENKNKNISFLPSDPIFLNGTLEKNINYLLDVEGIKLSKEEVYKIFKKFNFVYDLKTKVKKLSLAEKRVFAFIRSYIKRSKLLLVDDQFVGLNENELVFAKNAFHALINENNSEKTLISANNINIGVKFKKCVYLSYGKYFEFDNIESLINNPVDFYVSNYFGYNKKEMIIKNKNSQLFLCEYFEVFDKKRKNYEINIQNMFKICNYHDKNAENINLEEDEWIKVCVLSRNKITESCLKKVSESINKDLFIFEFSTGVRLF